MDKRRMSVFGLVAMLTIAVFGVAGCGGRSDAARQPGGGSEPAGQELSGSIAVVGSDTMVNLVQAWQEAFQAANEGVVVSVKGGGSGNGIAALINGTTDFAAASRDIKAEETEAAKKAGFEPVSTEVAKDGLTVVVNPANGVADLTIDQLGKIYRGEISNWKDVGGPDAAIVLLGRDTSSGTYEYFKDVVVGKDKEYAKSMRNLGSNQAIIDEVSKNAAAVGYVGIGYAESVGTVVRPVKVDGVDATTDNVLNGTYPLSRGLYMISKGAPGGVAKAYLDWILSAEGQQVVIDHGFVNVK